VIRWARGEDVIERLVRDGFLQRVSGAQASGEAWLERARRTVATGASVAHIDPASAYTLAYDGARFACAAVLAQQGLRATSRGGHLAVQEAIVAQFGDPFKPFRDLRIRRNELEYPAYADEMVEVEEATEAMRAAGSIVAAAERLLPHLRVQL
jgi:hypothetical protein